ncbi:MAG: hypothetical protein JJ892_12065 [Balneola sp.]|nr:hypothetical protein [Balneola sp.]MBO6651460.1 hypothetical protein [Balneola sp.]MBO6712503.1 hypothetical protein [Balneola sp.]MBO6801004.1 hypothetical protein [Balneola sp.]MBO6870676.1 hypothetical protein [Balneola sp.]
MNRPYKGFYNNNFILIRWYVYPELSQQPMMNKQHPTSSYERHISNNGHWMLSVGC